MSATANAPKSRRELLEPLTRKLARWNHGGPALFAVEALGVPGQWDDAARAGILDWQWEAGDALARSRRVSLRSGHGVGKSAFLAWAILWFLVTHFPAKVPVTAPTGHQLSDILWAELAKWFRILTERLPELAGHYEWHADAFTMRAFPKESFAVARTSRPDQTEALQGFHAENILFVIDEASGIPDAVFEVAEGALSSEGAFVLMASNPTRMQGFFFDSHHRDRAGWAALHVNGEDCPLVARSYVSRMRQRYGEDSAIYKIRVRGEFAGQAEGVIPLDVIEAAIDRDVEPYGEIMWGLDVARFGEDRTALAKRRANELLEPIKWWSQKDTMQTAGLIAAEYRDCPAPQKPRNIFVDVIGLGAGVVDRLSELGLPAVGVNVAEQPSVEEQYNRLRDELWFTARDWFFKRNCAIPDDQELIAELTLPKYSITSAGKKRVQAKDEIKKAGLSSPDLADAFCLTFAHGMAPAYRKQLVYPQHSRFDIA